MAGTLHHQKKNTLKHLNIWSVIDLFVKVMGRYLFNLPLWNKRTFHMVVSVLWSA